MGPIKRPMLEKVSKRNEERSSITGSHPQSVSGLKFPKYHPIDRFPVPQQPTEQQRIRSCLLQSPPECEPEPCLGFPLFPLSSLPPLSSHNLSQLRLQTVTQVGESSDTGLPDPPIASPTVYKIHFFSFRWSIYLLVPPLPLWKTRFITTL